MFSLIFGVFIWSLTFAIGSDWVRRAMTGAFMALVIFGLSRLMLANGVLV